MSLQEELLGPPPAKLIVEKVSKWFRTTRQTVHALDSVSLTIGEGIQAFHDPVRCRLFRTQEGILAGNGLAVNAGRVRP